VLDDMIQSIDVSSIIVGATADDLLQLLWWVWNANRNG
jgi:hypothetical protein